MFKSVRSTDLFLNLDVQVESRNCDLKKHMKIYSSNSTLVSPIYIHKHLFKIISEILSEFN